jgi:GNAT superfamily N-acetyltransferase
MSATDNIHPLQFTHELNAKTDKHTLEAHSAGGEFLGSMSWHNTKTVPDKAAGPGEVIHGAVTDIGVLAEHRGKGIAPAMWKAAQGYSPPPAHSPSRTPEGEHFAKKVGGYRPLTAGQLALALA